MTNQAIVRSIIHGHVRLVASARFRTYANHARFARTYSVILRSHEISPTAVLNRISKFSQGLNVDLRSGLRAAYRNAIDSRYFCQGYFRFIGYTRPLSSRKPARSGQDAIDRLRIDAWRSEKAEKEQVANVERRSQRRQSIRYETKRTDRSWKFQRRARTIESPF